MGADAPANDAAQPATASPKARRLTPREKFITRRRRLETAADVFCGTFSFVAGLGIYAKGLGGRRALFVASHIFASGLFFLVADDRQRRQVATHRVRPAVQGVETLAAGLWCVSAARQLMNNNYNVWFTGHNATTALFMLCYFTARYGATLYGVADADPTWDAPVAGVAPGAPSSSSAAASAREA